ncbi:HypC/HybG/HupF family hydrogenase formation chaperone [Patescibacteria group bacterium]
MPLKIKKINGTSAIVESGNCVDLSLVENIKTGDYVLVHADMALNKIEKIEAEKILKVISNLNK